MELRKLNSYKYKTKKQRLAIYEKALKDYTQRYKEVGGIDTFIWDKNETIFNNGLCFYFASRFYNVDTYDAFKEILPELYKTKPKQASDSGWWFGDGELLPRIKCLKKAIKITKSKIEKNAK